MLLLIGMFLLVPLVILIPHLLLLLLDGLLLVLAPLVLEPHPDDALRQPGHRRQLLLHDGVRPAVVVVESVQHRQLLLVQHRPLPRRLSRPPLAVTRVLAAVRSGHVTFSVHTAVGADAVRSWNPRVSVCITIIQNLVSKTDVVLKFCTKFCLADLHKLVIKRSGPTSPKKV